MPELIAGLGTLGLVLSIIAVVLFFFLPFYVAGIYNRIVQCQLELKKLNRLVEGLKIGQKQSLGKEDKVKSKMAERAQDPNSIFHEKNLAQTERGTQKKFEL